jgi:hypothetical protein
MNYFKANRDTLQVIITRFLLRKNKEINFFCIFLLKKAFFLIILVAY